MKLNYLHNGDCFEMLKSLPNNSVDLIVTSPPYNVGKEYEKKIDLNKYLDFQTNVIEECVRVLKDTGSIFWQVGSFSKDGMLIPLDVKFFPIFESFDMQPRNRIIWIRTHGLHGKNKFSGRHETVLWFTKTKDYKFNLDNIRVPQKYQNKKNYSGDKKGELSCNPDGKNPGDVWAFSNVKHNHEEQTIHPCQFPEDMIERIILSTTDSEDIVLDPFMGTGTVAVASKRHKRNYIGAELDNSYYEVALQRIAGKPDENGVFPNLRTLREHVIKTGEDINAYRFALQKGKKATERSKAKIFSEEHHLEAITDRLKFEEDTFVANINGTEPPKDPLKHNRKVKADLSQQRLL